MLRKVACRGKRCTETTLKLSKLGKVSGKRLVGARGFEPPTSRTRTVRSARLSYAPIRPARSCARDRKNTCAAVGGQEANVVNSYKNPPRNFHQSQAYMKPLKCPFPRTCSYIDRTIYANYPWANLFETYIANASTTPLSRFGPRIRMLAP